jgi:hypothetical protein
VLVVCLIAAATPTLDSPYHFMCSSARLKANRSVGGLTSRTTKLVLLTGRVTGVGVEWS